MSDDSEDSDRFRQNFMIVFVIGALAVVISLIHISYTKGRSKFVIVYATIALLVLALIAIGWPRPPLTVDAGTNSDSGVLVQEAEAVPDFHAEDTAFLPFSVGDAKDSGAEYRAHD